LAASHIIEALEAIALSHHTKIEIASLILGVSALASQPLNRRHFLLLSGASLSTALLLKACSANTTNTPTNSGSGDKPLSLQSISVPPANGKTTTGLIVFLHGFGANAQDLATFAPAMNLPDYQFMFPDAPYPHPSVSQGKMWYSLQSQDFQGLQVSRQQLLEWLKSLESTTGVPLSRTILGGFSQGGAMTLDVGLALPLAGLISLSGYLHSPPQPGNSLPPVLIVHGKRDQVVPVGAAQRTKESLTALGASVKYQEFDSMGHEIQPAVLALVRSFILDALK
jgi:phospholipase/carboxylesterase